MHQATLRGARTSQWRVCGLIAALCTTSLLIACGSSTDGGPDDLAVPTDPAVGGGGVPGSSGSTGPDPYLDARTEDYATAYRNAKLALVGDAPDMTEIQKINAAVDKKATYEGMIDLLIADTKRFAPQVVKFWRDTMKTGQQGAVQQNQVDLDTAPVFAAMVVIQDRPYGDLFTAKTGTCPTFDPVAATFTPADCTNMAPVTAGVLTNPAILSQYDSNMAFRRVRFVQETFACSKFPAERTSDVKQMGAGVYNNPWPFESIIGKKTKTDARIDFQDTSAVICANCHGTMNHQAPLFANFNPMGVYNAQIQVKVPIPGTPTAKLDDWLPAGQKTAWRLGKDAQDLAEFGTQMAADDDVNRCIVTRTWNWAMSRGDVVDDVSPVPKTISDPLLADFKAGGFKVKALIAKVFKAPDFVKF